MRKGLSRTDSPGTFSFLRRGTKSPAWTSRWSSSTAGTLRYRRNYRAGDRIWATCAGSAHSRTPTTWSWVGPAITIRPAITCLPRTCMDSISSTDGNRCGWGSGSRSSWGARPCLRVPGYRRRLTAGRWGSLSSARVSSTAGPMRACVGTGPILCWNPEPCAGASHRTCPTTSANSSASG